jgi:methionyl-tRNA synthetase
LDDFLEEDEEKIVVTSALPYAYSVPHLGNFTGSVLPADVYYKYLKMKGADALFICGSDQHGTPIELRAIKNGVTPESLADEMHEKIKDLFEKFGCTFTIYGKTHTKNNRETVYEVFEGLRNNGYITETESLHAYCETDNRFLADRLIEGTCPYCKGEYARGDQCDSCGRLLDPTDLIKPHCTICGKNTIKFVKAKSLALALDKLQGMIGRFISERSKNWTKNAANKSASIIKEGLKERDITRNMKWGFPVPVDGFKDSVFYVWFDALIGYIGITKDWNIERWADYWMDPDTKIIHFMGKDNIEFHTTVWPGSLIGSGIGYALPHTIYALEHLTSKTVKFSKSKGVGLDMELALELLPSDYWRFTLINLLPETSDSEFSVPILVEIVNKIMNDKIGNLLHRVLTIAKTNSSLVSGAPLSKERTVRVEEIVDGYRSNFEKIKIREALRGLVELADYGNSIMSSEEPWVLASKAKTDSGSAAKFDAVMSDLINIVYRMCILLWPFAPEASLSGLKYFGFVGDPSLDSLNLVPKMKSGIELKPIFQKVPKEIVERLDSIKKSE